MANKCLSCGAILPEGAKLCTNCGKIVPKKTRQYYDAAPQRRAVPDVQTQSRVYSHKPTTTAVMDIVEQAPVRHEQPQKPHTQKPHTGSKKKSKAKKKPGKARLIIAFAVLAIVLMLLLYMLVYMLKVGEAKAVTYTSDTAAKMSYSTFGEASENFFDKAQWSYHILSGEVTVEGKNKGTYYKYVFEDGKVSYIIVGEEKLTDQREIDILIQRMFI